jgi:hypothetical protein
MKTAAIGLAVLLPACTGTGQLAPLNDAAAQLGTPRLEFVRQGTGQGPVTVTMPDGGAIGFGSASAFGPRGFAYGKNCRGEVSFGHGGGTCRLLNGAEFQVIF